MADDAMRGILARLGVQVDVDQLLGADDAISGFVGQLRQLAGILAGGAVVGALHSLVDATSEAADSINTTAQRLQIATDSLQEWNYVAKLSDVETTEFQAAITGLTRQLQGVSEGSEKPAAALRKLGIEAKDADGNIRGFEDLLPEIADAMQALPNDTERAGLSMRLFGRSGMALLPMLKQGSAGIEGLRAEFRDLGGGMSGEALDQLNEYRDQIDRLDTSMVALKSQISLAVLPAFQAVANAAIWISRQLTELDRRTHVVRLALGLAGAAVAAFAVKSIVALTPVIAPILAIGAGIAVLVLAVDDLWTTFEGGESVIQSLVDELYGVGTTAEIIDGLIMLWDDLTTSILRAAAAAGEMISGNGFAAAMAASAAVEDRGDMRTRERLEKQAAAVESGDVEGFVRSRQAAGRVGVTEARDEFLEKRREAIASGRVKATEQDVGAGLADKVGGHVKLAPIDITAEGVRGPRTVNLGGGVARGGKTQHVQAQSTVTINLPPGSDHATAERMRKVAQEVWDGQMRTAAAALTGTGGDGG